jgi:hypothetical protein
MIMNDDFGKDMKGSNRGLIYGTAPAFAWRV